MKKLSGFHTLAIGGGILAIVGLALAVFSFLLTVLTFEEPPIDEAGNAFFAWHLLTGLSLLGLGLMFVVIGLLADSLARRRAESV